MYEDSIFMIYCQWHSLYIKQFIEEYAMAYSWVRKYPQKTPSTSVDSEIWTYNMKQIGATYIRASHSYNCLFFKD